MNLYKEVDAEFPRHLQFLKEFSAFTTASSVSESDKDRQAVALWLEARCREAGLETELIRTKQGRPAVVAQTELRNHVPHVFLYGHYDVEAGSAADLRGLLVAHLCALRAFHLVAGYQPVDLTLLLEGDRNLGSPNLVAHLKYLAGKRAPFDLGLLALTSARGPEAAPEKDKLRPNEAESILMETAESAWHGTATCLVEPFHSVLGVKACVTGLRDGNRVIGESDSEQFQNGIKIVMRTLIGLAEEFQAYQSVS